MIEQHVEEHQNEHGFIDFILIDENGEADRYTGSNKLITVCPQCHCMVMENRGQGCLCGSCEAEFDSECEADRDAGWPFF